MNKFTKQCVAAVASLAMAGTLCVAGAVVAGSSAWAEDTCNSGAPWAPACASQKGTITIMKYEDKGEGNKSTPIAGAKFKVTKVNGYDLTKYSDWENLAKKVAALNSNPNDASLSLDTEHAKEVPTDDGTKGTTKGQAKFPDLGIGLYKVEEIEAAPGYSKDVTPFFMTIPQITHKSGANATYDYNVTADPKNQNLAGKIKKELVRTDGNGTEFVGKGDAMTYKITADVLSTDNLTPRTKWTKDNLKGYTVFDQAPAGVFTSYEGATVVKSAKVAYTENGAAKFAILKDKTTNKISVETEDIKGSDNTTVVAKRIKVAFTTDDNGGLADIAKAAAADPNAKVEIEFAFTIDDISKASGNSFTNKSGFISGKSDNSPKPDPKVPDGGGSQVESHYGFFQVNKYDGTTDKTSGTKLAGAKFKLFAKQADADKCAADTSATECGKASNVGELTTVEGGKFANPVKVVVDDSTHPFYIVETEAPANYERDHQAHAVNVSASSTAAAPTPVDIANVPTKDNGSWFKLPKTGAAGVIIFALIGLGLVGSGMFVFLKNRKKEEEQQAA